MGNGQIGGNGSVEWVFTHHDEFGTIVPLTLGNGVNRVQVVSGKARCKDPIRVAAIGTRPGFNSAGFFIVTLTYASATDRDRALTSAKTPGSSLVIEVPAVDRGAAFPQNLSRPTEIRVDW